MTRQRHSVKPAHGTSWIAALKSQPGAIAAVAVAAAMLAAAPFMVAAYARGQEAAPTDQVRAAEKPTAKPAAAVRTDTKSEPESKTAPKPVASPEAPAAEATEPARPKNRTELIAFYANWDDESVLEPALDEVDVLMPMWYHLDSKGRITVDDKAKQDRIMRMIKRSGSDIKVMPILNNYDKPTESWNAPAVGKLLANPKKRRAIAKETVRVLKRDGFDGVNIDFESFTAKDKKNLVAFMKELYPRARKAGLTVSMDVIVSGSAYDHAKLARHVDYLIPMMYDEHWKTSGPGPISSVGWYERTLNSFYKKVPRNKVIVGIGTYAYDWGKSGQRAKSYTYADAKRLSRKYRKPMKVHPAALNSTFAYKSGGVGHKVWVLDAISAFNQLSVSSKKPPRGYAIWRLGSEDPSAWDVFSNRDSLDESVAESLESSKRTVRYDASRRMIVRGTTRP